MSTKPKETFQNYLIRNGIRTTAKIRDAVKGKRFRIIESGRSTGQNYGLPGDVFIADNPGLAVSTQYGTGLTLGGNTIYWYELELVNPSTVEELEKDLDRIKSDVAKLEAEYETTKLKIAFIKENQLEEFNEDQFKVYQTLQVLKTKKSDIEKAKLIAQLIKSQI